MKENATFLAGLLVPIALIFAFVDLATDSSVRVVMIAALVGFVLFWLSRHRREFVKATGLVAAACLFGSILLILQGSDHFAAAIVLLLPGLALAILGRKAKLVGSLKPAAEEGLPIAVSNPPARTPLQYDLCPECHGVKTVTRLATKRCEACGGTGLVGPDRCPRDCDSGKSWEWETVECPTCLGHGRVLG
ncbi:hypothetical protein AAE029_31270 [Sinorhizobium sp. CB7]